MELIWLSFCEYKDEKSPFHVSEQLYYSRGSSLVAATSVSLVGHLGVRQLTMKGTSGQCSCDSSQCPPVELSMQSWWHLLSSTRWSLCRFNRALETQHNHCWSEAKHKKTLSSKVRGQGNLNKIYNMNLLQRHRSSSWINSWLNRFSQMRKKSGKCPMNCLSLYNCLCCYVFHIWF